MDKNGDGVVTKEVGSDILSTHAHTKSLQQNKTNHCNKKKQISVELLEAAQVGQTPSRKFYFDAPSH